MMKRIVAVLLFVLCVSTSGTSQESVTPKLAMSADSLNPIAKQFWDYRTDFNQYTSNLREDAVESSVARSLEDVAEQAGDFAVATSTLYEHLTCPADRDLTRRAIQHSADLYADRLDTSIALTKLGLSTAHSPGVAQAAARMKDDLRSLQSSLKSLE
jgi:hypothetical protein